MLASGAIDVSAVDRMNDNKEDVSNAENRVGMAEMRLGLQCAIFVGVKLTRTTGGC